VWPLCTEPGGGAAVRTNCVRLVNSGLPSHGFLSIELSWLVTYDEVSCDAGRSLGGLLGLIIERDLFGTIRLVRNWGWIGTNGRELAEVFATEIEAGQALEALAKAKRRRGYRDL
jgi:WGR domain